MKQNEVIKQIQACDTILQETKNTAISYIKKCYKDAEEARKVHFAITASDLPGMFVWDRTPQGHNFWSELNVFLEGRSV